MLTACGIETRSKLYRQKRVLCPVATVLTACGIETDRQDYRRTPDARVATVLTACGIETDV